VRTKDNQDNEHIVEVFALTAAGILLNFGLFFMFAIFTPLIVGAASGFFCSRFRVGALVGALSAAVAYSIILIVTATAVIDFIALFLAVLLMTFLGVIGGVLGVFLHQRAKYYDI
jgi:hypothetical protein